MNTVNNYYGNMMNIFTVNWVF